VKIAADVQKIAADAENLAVLHTSSSSGTRVRRPDTRPTPSQNRILPGVLTKIPYGHLEPKAGGAALFYDLAHGEIEGKTHLLWNKGNGSILRSWIKTRNLLPED